VFSGIEAGKPAVMGRKKGMAEQSLDRSGILKELGSLENTVIKLRAMVSKKKQ